MQLHEELSQYLATRHQVTDSAYPYEFEKVWKYSEYPTSTKAKKALFKQFPLEQGYTTKRVWHELRGGFQDIWYLNDLGLEFLIGSRDLNQPCISRSVKPQPVKVARPSPTSFLNDLDDIWQDAGYSSKQNALIVLRKFFKLNIDFVKREIVQHTDKSSNRHHKYWVSDKCKETLTEYRHSTLLLNPHNNHLEVNLEVEVSRRLASSLNAEREVRTPVGRIDVLSEDYVIEVKEFSQWKAGFGQVFVYQQYHPDKKAVLYLYGDINHQMLNQIVKCCAKGNVEVWHEQT